MKRQTVARIAWEKRHTGWKPVLIQKKPHLNDRIHPMFLRNTAHAVTVSIIRKIYLKIVIGHIVKGIRHITPYNTLNPLAQPPLKIQRHIRKQTKSTINILQRKIAAHPIKLILHLTVAAL